MFTIGEFNNHSFDKSFAGRCGGNQRTLHPEGGPLTGCPHRFVLETRLTRRRIAMRREPGRTAGARHRRGELILFRVSDESTDVPAKRASDYLTPHSNNSVVII